MKENKTEERKTVETTYDIEDIFRMSESKFRAFVWGTFTGEFPGLEFKRKDFITITYDQPKKQIVIKHYA